MPHLSARRASCYALAWSAFVLSALLGSRPAVAQQPGTLDAAFGTGGRLQGNFLSASGSDMAKDVLVQPDGKIMVAGQSNAGVELCRLNADGSLDATFGTGGKASYAFGGGTYGPSTGTGPSRPRRIFRLANGHYYLVGRASPAGFVARLQSNGTLDATFGTAGVVKMMPGSHGETTYDVGVQSSGKVVLFNTVAQLSSYAANVGRHNADGTQDTGFFSGIGTYLHYTTALGLTSYSGCTAGLVLPDDKILAAGCEFTDNMNAACAGVAKLLPDGTRDASFGTNGLVALPHTVNGSPIKTTFHSLAVQPDGKILLAGSYSEANSGYTQGLVARLLPSGALDPSFAVLGYATIGCPGRYTQVFTRIGLQPDGKIVAAGFAQGPYSNPNDPSTDFTLARLDATGGLDPSFGTNGQVLLHDSPQNMFRAVALQPADGKIVAAGYVASGGGSTLYTSLEDVTIAPNYPNRNDDYNGAPQNGQFAVYRFHGARPLATKAPQGIFLAVYPNPAAGQVTVEASGLPTGPVTVRLVNALGQVAQQQVLTAGAGGLHRTLTLPKLPAGVYSLQLSTEQGTTSQRLVLQ